MKVVVSDSAPLIGLSMIGRFDLLRALFGRIHIPESVYQEVAVEGKGKPGAKEVEEAVKEGWIAKHKLHSSLALILLKVDLDVGEAEALILADERKADLLLMDERKGRIRAEQMGLEVTGTIGVLLLAREAGIEIDMQSALDGLRSKGFRISDRLYQKILKKM